MIRRRLRFRPTYSGVIATLCLFLLLGGGAYAALKLPKNSVGTKQIKNKAVTPAKLSAAARATLRGPVGATGPTGPAGPSGPAIPAGPAFEVDRTNQPHEIDVTTAVTPVMEEALSAGAYVLSAEVVFNNHTDTNPAVVECTLSAGTDSAKAGIYIVGTAAVMNMTLPLQLTHTFATPGTASVSCKKATANGSAFVEYGSLIATQVSSQTRTTLP